MNEFSLYQGDRYCGIAQDLNEAIALAEKSLDHNPDDKTTVTVEDQHGYLLASVTNRRIEGCFNKQCWGGRNGDDALGVGEEVFDATDAVLLMSHELLVQVRDNRESSDDIGRDHVSWVGPCYVTIVDSICDYFGVDDIGRITPEALEFSRQRAKPRPATYHIITLEVTLELRVQPGANTDGFMKLLESSFSSRTSGVTVSDQAIVATSAAGFV